MTEGLTNIDRVRLALAMVDAGYSWEIEIEYVEELLSSFDALSDAAQPQYLTGCLLDGVCRGVCEFVECPNHGMVIAARVCVFPKEDGVVYPGGERS